MLTVMFVCLSVAVSRSLPPSLPPSFCQVKWDGEWWQAKIKVNKMERGTDKPDKVLVSYVGGTSEDDEWVPLSSRRLRPPTEAFGDTTRGH